MTLVASMGMAWSWVVTLRRMTEISPRPVGFVDDLSACFLLTAIVLIFRLFNVWLGRICFVAFCCYIMLKTRLIPIIVLKNDLIVQSIGFNQYLPIGNIKIAIEFFVNWDVDEIVLVDIDATKENRVFPLELAVPCGIFQAFSL